MKKLDVEMNEKTEDLKQKEDEQPQNNIFDTEEIRIEELAIDGICGVY
jgi:mycofactocin precursor